jgi:hypothetical protein
MISFGRSSLQQKIYSYFYSERVCPYLRICNAIIKFLSSLPFLSLLKLKWHLHFFGSAMLPTCESCCYRTIKFIWSKTKQKLSSIKAAFFYHEKCTFLFLMSSAYQLQFSNLNLHSFYNFFQTETFEMRLN